MRSNIIFAVKQYLAWTILSSLLLSACQTAALTHWRWAQADAGLPRQVTTLAVTTDPVNSNRIWVGAYTAGGLAHSQDGGQTWTTFTDGLTDNPIFDLLFIPSTDAESSGSLWAATRAGLMLSRDGGTSWQPAAGLPPVTVFALAADASGRVYVGLDDAGVFVQTAQGWESLAASKVEDEAESLHSAAVLSLDVSADGRQLYAGTAGRGVFASRDGGRTWANSYPGNYAPNLALNPANPAQAVASLRNRLVRTQDGGKSWRTLPVAWARDEIVSLLWLADGALGAGTGQGRLYYSRNGGDSWVEGGAGLPSGGVLDLAVAAGSPPLRLWAATWTGVYASDDGGETWQNMAPALGSPNAFTILSTDQGLLLGTRAGLFRWQPDNRRWISVPGDFPTGGITSLASDPQNSQILYTGTSSNGLYSSQDGGGNWQRLPTRNFGIPAVAVDPKDSERIYILAAWERVYESRDGGQGWDARWKGLGETIEATSIAVDPVQPLVYVGTETGLYRSYDGRTWRLITPSLADQTILALLAQPTPPNAGGGSVLYLGTTRGVYRSLTGGTTVQGGEGWGQGLENISVTALLADPDNPGSLFAGTAYKGVYQSVDWGYTWQAMGPTELAADTIAGLAWGPAGELFVAASSGVWAGVRMADGE
jgi:ligand-binding sensor domain-containing protein